MALGKEGKSEKKWVMGYDGETWRQGGPLVLDFLYASRVARWDSVWL